MLLIREAQMKVFRDKSLQDFENGRVADIARRFPARYAELGEEKTRSVIRAGIGNSARMGIRHERDVRNLVDLMIFFGESFDSDLRFAFETAPLRNNDLPAQARVELTMSHMGVEPGFHE